MRKILVLIFVTIGIAVIAQTQPPKVSIYNPAANANEEIQSAVSKASAEGKHVLIQVGGNWCPWCIRLHKFIHENHQLDSIINVDYVFILVNYSKENKNPAIMQEFEFPQRFGFPVLVVLDDKGRRIHTQDTGLLEEGEGYSEKKVKQFLISWNRAALDPSRYSN